MTTYGRRRTAYHHGSLRPTLLRAAGELLENRGAAHVALRSLARSAGVSHSAPNRHFADREALLAALAAEGFAMLGERLRGKPAREMGEAYVRFALEQPQRFRLMFGGALRLAKYPQLRDAAAHAHQALVEALRELSRPELAAAAAWALVHGLAQLLLDGHFANADREAFVRDVLGIVRFAQRAA
jgi:AcrR family transcriptional regulator